MKGLFRKRADRYVEKWWKKNGYLFERTHEDRSAIEYRVWRPNGLILLQVIRKKEDDPVELIKEFRMRYEMQNAMEGVLKDKTRPEERDA